MTYVRTGSITKISLIIAKIACNIHMFIGLQFCVIARANNVYLLEILC